jgi:hypothetical protein
MTALAERLVDAAKYCLSVKGLSTKEALAGDGDSKTHIDIADMRQSEEKMEEEENDNNDEDDYEDEGDGSDTEEEEEEEEEGMMTGLYHMRHPLLSRPIPGLMGHAAEGREATSTSTGSPCTYPVIYCQSGLMCFFSSFIRGLSLRLYRRICRDSHCDYSRR